MSFTNNPLLENSLLPKFTVITAAHIEPALDTILEKNRKNIDDVLAQLEKEHDASAFLSTHFFQTLEQCEDDLGKMWSIVCHLNAVKNSPELRVAYNACLPKITEYATHMGQNKTLYNAYKQLSESDRYNDLSTAQKKAIDNTLRDFMLSGIALDEAGQQRFGEIKQRLAQLSTEYSNNVLDATHGWVKHITDSEELAGVSAAALQSYKEAANAKELDGYVISLDVPAYLPVMQYCDNAALRKEMYFAYTTRASDQGINAEEWDNSALMSEILSLRHELSMLLGFTNYAEKSLATKMASSPQQVIGFMEDLVEKSFSVAGRDFLDLKNFAKQFSDEALNAWDVPYFSEKLRLEKYALSQEELRSYFPADKVIGGMFDVVNKLFSIDVKEEQLFDSWHDDVRLFHLYRDGELIAKFYLDLFARKGKRGGAWMADCSVRRTLPDASVQIPVAFITCNFTAPSDDLPSLLTHNDVITLFHEFGHGLHHMLTTIDCAAVSGINGVPWDAVELPSQFLENWGWEKQAIELISGHYQTGEVLPPEMLEKMLAAKNFQSGMQMMRQLEFALFDMKLHMEYQQEKPKDIQATLNEVRAQVAVYEVPTFNRFQHSFSHIFAGGYAAGYYSYKWAEVLSADAFSRFEEDGVFNRETGQQFLEEILARGGSQDPMQLFINFRGREPSTAALLRHSMIVSDEIRA